MCYIMISRKVNNNRNLATEAKLRNVALSKLKVNPDGFFIQDAKGEMRTMDDKEAVKHLEESGFDNLMMHFRTATVGKKHESNVHGWTQGHFQFLHNGGVSDYAPTKPIGYSLTNTHEDTSLLQEDTDSKLLFDSLISAIGKDTTDKKILQAIRTTIDSVRFWGRAVLYDQQADKAFIFGDWHVYLCDDSYLVFSSHNINVVQEFTKKTHGIPFEFSEKPLLETEFDGIAIIKDFSKPKFRFKYRGRLELEQPLAPRLMSYDSSYGLSPEDDEYDPTEPWKDGIYEGMRYPDPDENMTFGDIMDSVPEYQTMDPFEFETLTDETGTHDIYGICCRYGTCYIYNDYEFMMQNRRKTERIAAMAEGSEPLPF